MYYCDLAAGNIEVACYVGRCNTEFNTPHTEI